MKKIIALMALTLVASTVTFAETVKPLYIVHVNMGNNELSSEVYKELLRPSMNSSIKNRPVIILKPNLDIENNPFGVTRTGFEFGQALLSDGRVDISQAPVLNEKMISWFENLEKQQIFPEIFIMNGHHTVGMGFKSDNSWNTRVKDQYGTFVELPKRSLYVPTLVNTKNRVDVVKRFFNRVKLVFVGGCESLSDINSLESLRKYKKELAVTYPGEYTLNEKEEVCADRVQKKSCEILDLNRVLPETAMKANPMVYSSASQLKSLFPHAKAIFGFATPSPFNPGKMWKSMFNLSRVRTQANNILLPLLDDTTNLSLTKNLIQNMRLAWTQSTARLNRVVLGGRLIERVSGSITPAFADLDQGGLFVYSLKGSEKMEAAVPKVTAAIPQTQIVEEYNPTQEEDPVFFLIKQQEINQRYEYQKEYSDDIPQP